MIKRERIGRLIFVALVSCAAIVGSAEKRSVAQLIPGVPSQIPTTWVLPFPVGTAVSGPVATGPALFPRGVEFMDVAKYAKIAKSFAPAMGNLPPSADLSAEFPPPGDQGNQGSCVAWAIGYGFKGYEEHAAHAWAYSKDHLFSPAFIYNSLSKGKCQSGLNIFDAFDFVRTSGVAPLTLMSYDPSDCSASPSESARATAKTFRLTSVLTVAQDLVEIKSHLASNTPIVVAMDLDDSFDYLKGQQVYAGPKGPYTGGHAMVMVGYDDSRQAFRVFNSWGKKWGDNGLGWVRYNVLISDQTRELYVAKNFDVQPDPTPTPVPDPKPTPTPTPTPSAKPPKATLSKVTTMKNILVGDTYYFGLAVTGKIDNAAGKKYRLVVRFEKGGSPIKSTDAKYADSHGYLAAGTPEQVLASASFNLTGAPSIAVPQLTLKTSLGSSPGEKVDVDVYYDAYVDGFHVGRSPTSTVTFVWN